MNDNMDMQPVVIPQSILDEHDKHKDDVEDNSLPFSDVHDKNDLIQLINEANMTYLDFRERYKDEKDDMGRAINRYKRKEIMQLKFYANQRFLEIVCEENGLHWNPFQQIKGIDFVKTVPKKRRYKVVKNV